MGAERTQKGAVGQQLAASGRARRAEAIRRKGSGEGGPNIGRDVSRAVMEDRMDQNDKEGKQKQGKPGKPGRPLPPQGKPFPPEEGRPFEPPWMDGRTPKPPRDKGVRPPVMKPIEEGGRPFPPKEGRPVEPPIDGRPFPVKPPGGKPDYDITLPYFPGKPPVGGRPGKPDMPDPRPPGGGRPFIPGRGFPGGPPLDDRRTPIQKEKWIQRKKEMEMKRKEDMWRKAIQKKGGTDFGPGRGDRLPEGAEQDTYFSQDRFDALRQQGGQNLERPGAAATTLQDFMAQMANLRSGGIK